MPEDDCSIVKIATVLIAGPEPGNDGGRKASADHQDGEDVKAVIGDRRDPAEQRLAGRRRYRSGIELVVDGGISLKCV
jgi:hypothetical protein